jgi:KDO2-lipid IV(A) lauroyltransferase
MLTLFRLLSRLPLRVLRGLGAAAGLAVYALSAGYRRKLRANLAQAGLREPGLARRAAAEAGRMVGELPFVWFRPPAEVVARVACDDIAVFERAEGAGRGIVFLTPHLGAFEIAARYYASRAPVTVLFKPPKQPSLAVVMDAARRSPGLTAVPATLAGLRPLLRALRRGEAVGLLPDQVPSDGEGRWVPFFGAPAYTMALPQKLVESTGAAVLMVLGERLPGGAGWRMRAWSVDEAPTPEAINRAMEDLIRRWPSQYLWGYNRYKRPSGADPA